MKNLWIILLLVSLTQAFAAENKNAETNSTLVLPRYDNHDAMKLYRASLFTLAGAQTADIASSWGRRELNPILTPGSSSNRFGYQAVGIKTAFLSSSLAVQSYAIRRNHRLRRPFAIVNFITAAALSAVAFSNAAR